MVVWQLSRLGDKLDVDALLERAGGLCMLTCLVSSHVLAGTKHDLLIEQRADIPLFTRIIRSRYLLFITACRCIILGQTWEIAASFVWHDLVLNLPYVLFSGVFVK